MSAPDDCKAGAGDAAATPRRATLMARAARVVARLTARRGARFEAAIDDLVDRWYTGEGEGMTLGQWLAMDVHQYTEWMILGRVPAGYTLPERPR